MNIMHCMRRTNLVCALFILLFIEGLSACGGESPVGLGGQRPPNPTGMPTLVMPTPLSTKPTTTVTIRELERRWLQGLPCRAPCWEGITPGQTTVAAALDILNQHPLITNIHVKERVFPESGLNDIVVWQWQGAMEEANGEFGITWQGDTPIVAWLSTYSEQPYNLRELIAAYGEPDAVVPLLTSGRFGLMSDISVIYHAKGIFLRTDWTLGLPPIDPDLKLSHWVTLFPPTDTGLDGAVKNYRTWNHTALIPWQGFQPFAAYCRQVRPSEEYTDNICPKIDIDI